MAQVAHILAKAENRALETGSWVVVACADGHTYQTALRALSGPVVVGRTAVLYPQGKLSVVHMNDSVHVPPGEGYDLVVVGYSKETTRRLSWINGAETILSY